MRALLKEMDSKTPRVRIRAHVGKRTKGWVYGGTKVLACVYDAKARRIKSNFKFLPSLLFSLSTLPCRFDRESGEKKIVQPASFRSRKEDSVRTEP